MLAFLQHVVFLFPIDSQHGIPNIHTKCNISYNMFPNTMTSMRLQFSIQLCPLNTFTPYGFHCVVTTRVEWQTT